VPVLTAVSTWFLRRGGEVVAVQCKKWTVDLVGVEKVRELQGALPDHGAARGIFVTLGEFTPDATAYAGRRGLELVSGETLRGMLPTPVASESAASATGHGEVICPQCGSLMVERRGRRGPFWGCRRYRKCHGTRPLTAG
jgi:restriction system protein